MRQLEARPNHISEMIPSSLHKKIERFTNSLLDSLQSQIEENPTWAVVSLHGEVLYQGTGRSTTELSEVSLF
ncbi:MAG: hypothetical protein MUF77_04095 [Leptospira sp.]|jgi:predicted AlkP superfamily pyrophosphatase or phosphodiesterase|nr:hypothetical protein [Leptospira sp.]